MVQPTHNCQEWIHYCESMKDSTLRNESLLIAFSESTTKTETTTDNVNSVVKPLMEHINECNVCYLSFFEVNDRPLPFPCRSFQLAICHQEKYHLKSAKDIFSIYSACHKPIHGHRVPTSMREIEDHVDKCNRCSMTVNYVAKVALFDTSKKYKKTHLYDSAAVQKRKTESVSKPQRITSSDLVRCRSIEPSDFDHNI